MAIRTLGTAESPGMNPTSTVSRRRIANPKEKPTARCLVYQPKVRDSFEPRSSANIARIPPEYISRQWREMLEAKRSTFVLSSPKLNLWSSWSWLTHRRLQPAPDLSLLWDVRSRWGPLLLVQSRARGSPGTNPVAMPAVYAFNPGTHSRPGQIHRPWNGSAIGGRPGADAREPQVHLILARLP